MIEHFRMAESTLCVKQVSACLFLVLVISSSSRFRLITETLVAVELPTKLVGTPAVSGSELSLARHDFHVTAVFRDDFLVHVFIEFLLLDRCETPFVGHQHKLPTCELELGTAKSPH